MMNLTSHPIVVISHPQTLHTLNLGMNVLGAEGVKYITDALRVNQV